MHILRTLNWLDKEHRCSVPRGAEAALIAKQQAAARAQLPHSLLTVHDRFAAQGKPSIVPLAGSNCSACHLKLPSGVLGEVRTPGRYTTCPTCSAFVHSTEMSPVQPEVAPTKKTGRNRASKKEANLCSTT
jgi:hypothetical protein